MWLANKVTTMYLAPLNYDRFFKKVFSDLRISKNFLEAFLGVKIETIENLKNEFKITDDASVVRFDFRCKIEGQYVIIDMQQWHKTDIIKRFYVYHTLNTALQLEGIPMKSLTLAGEKEYVTKDYHGLEPVITLIWMSSDSLKFSEDFITFALYPEPVVDFCKNEILWTEGNLENIENERKKVLTLLNNQTKDLNFLSKNKLIYAFQKNIVKNKKYSPYFEWFEFAEKTLDKKNTKKDFAKYEKNEIFMAVIQRINKETLLSDDFTYITDWALHEERAKRYDDSLRDAITKEIRREVIEELKEKEIKKAKKEKEKIKESVRKEVKEEVMNKAKIKFIISSHKEGLEPFLIAKISNSSVEEVLKIIENYKKSLEIKS